MEFSRWMVTLLLLLCLVHHLPAVFEADLYACPGGTVTLSCDGPADKVTSVVWIFGSRTIYSFKNGISKCEHPHFVSRTQLRSIRQNNFSLVINPVRLQDQGEYKCLINGAEIQINRLFVKDSLVCKQNKDKEVPDENSPGALSSVWLIVNQSVIVVIVGLLVWFIKRRRNQPGTQMRTEPMPNPDGVQANYEMVPCSPPP